jgi:hypothetical protein
MFLLCNIWPLCNNREILASRSLQAKMLQSLRVSIAVLLCMAASCEAAPVQHVAIHNFTDCGSTVLIPTSVSLTPDPPKKGSKWAIGFTAKPTRPITNGTLDVSVKIWGFPISHKLDICYGGDGWPGCPFDGPINITDWNPAIPRFGPSGPFEGVLNDHLFGTDTDNAVTIWKVSSTSLTAMEKS